MDKDEIIYLEFRWSLVYATAQHQAYAKYQEGPQDELIEWASRRASIDVEHEIELRLSRQNLHKNIWA